MFRSLSSAWLCYRSDHRGFCSGTSLLVILMLCLYNCGIQASLTVGPGGDFPRVSDVLLYAISHDELPALLFSVILLVSVGRFQERRWGAGGGGGQGQELSLLDSGLMKTYLFCYAWVLLSSNKYLPFGFLVKLFIHWKVSFSSSQV
uniref:Uncharacterized protein n=1 Tax=Tetraodon nigroviridis TaxID=99883 RepID=H3DEJ7_TETNG